MCAQGLGQVRAVHIHVLSADPHWVVLPDRRIDDKAENGFTAVDGG